MDQQVLVAAILTGVSAFGFTAIVRNLIPLFWLLVKPFSCALCMAWWGSVLGSLTWWLVFSPFEIVSLKGVLSAGFVLLMGTGIGRFLNKVDEQKLGGTEQVSLSGDQKVD